jgi:hypothetical protein
LGGHTPTRLLAQIECATGNPSGTPLQNRPYYGNEAYLNNFVVPNSIPDNPNQKSSKVLQIEDYKIPVKFWVYARTSFWFKRPRLNFLHRLKQAFYQK